MKENSADEFSYDEVKIASAEGNWPDKSRVSN